MQCSTESGWAFVDRNLFEDNMYLCGVVQRVYVGVVLASSLPYYPAICDGAYLVLAAVQGSAVA